MIITPPGFTLDLQATPDDDAIAHLFIGNRLLMTANAPAMQSLGQYRALGFQPTRPLVLGRHQGRLHIAVGLPDDTPPPEGWEARNLRGWFGALDDAHLAIAMRGVQLVDWARTNRFCGACGHATEQQPNERGMRCSACGLVAYPRICPAMMTLVTRGRQVLLARNINFPPGRYSALAGFLEAGESIEDAIHREVREEVGIEVHQLRYFASQSWPFPNSLMIAFTAEWLSGELAPDPAEIADARWFELDALPDLPPAGISISRALIDDTVQRLRSA